MKKIIVVFGVIGFCAAQGLSASLLWEFNKTKPTEGSVQVTGPIPSNTKYGILFDGEISSIIGDAESGADNRKNFSNVSFGIYLDNPKFFVSALIRVVDADKNRTTNYALDLYNPKGSDKIGGILDFRIINLLKPFDLCFYGAIGSNTWILPDGAFPGVLKREHQATIISVGLNMMLAVENPKAENPFFAGAYLGGGYKAISGNIGFNEYDDLREEMLGSVKNPSWDWS